MFGQAVQFNGDSFESSKFRFVNKTGSQLVKGGVYALDLTSTDPTTVSTRTRISNLVGVSAANLAGILLVAEAATNPNEFGDGVIMGLTQAYVSGANSPGAQLKASNGSTALSAASSAIGNTDQRVALLIDQTFAQITAPTTGPTLTANASGGQLAGGQTLYFKYAWQGAGGITTPSNELNVAIGASTFANNSVTVASAVVAPVGTTSMVVYVGTAPGAEVLAGSVNVAAGATATYTLQNLPPSSNAAPLATNTTGTQLATVFFCGIPFMGSNQNPAIS